nr:hypothetical protein Iba_chr12cCG14870 [Ipomoea batatas]
MRRWWETTVGGGGREAEKLLRQWKAEVRCSVESGRCMEAIGLEIQRFENNKVAICWAELSKVASQPISREQKGVAVQLLRSCGVMVLRSRLLAVMTGVAVASSVVDTGATAVVLDVLAIGCHRPLVRVVGLKSEELKQKVIGMKSELRV